MRERFRGLLSREGVAVGVAAALAAKGLAPADFDVARASLEDVYLSLTGDTGDGPETEAPEEGS